MSYGLFLFKHPAMRTIAFKVLKSFYVKEKMLWSLKIEWYKISTHKPPESTRLTEHIKLSKSKWREFELIGINAKTDIPTQFLVVANESGRIEELDIRKLEKLGSQVISTEHIDTNNDTGNVD